MGMRFPTVRTELSDSPSYRGQQTFKAKLFGPPNVLTTTVTTGVISSAVAISTAQITSFATRFGSTFDEYRILGANIQIRPLTVSTGVTRFWFNEKSATAPAANDSFERTGITLDNTNANSKSNTTMTWRARDLLDLQYTPIGTASTPAYFDVYTNNGNWGAPVTATALWIYDMELLIEFRGINSV